MARPSMAAERISMSMTTNPPRWAEALLRAFVKPCDFESVSGDLLEQYRDSIYPARGRFRADLWYVMLVFTFVSPGVHLFAALFSAQFLIRTALDWFLPTANFHFRSTLSAAGFLAAWRSDSFATGAIGGSLTAAIAAIMSIAGGAVMLAIWHDPQTMAAIRSSGGFAEVLSLPLFMVLPGALLGVCGGVASAALKRLFLFSRP